MFNSFNNFVRFVFFRIIVRFTVSILIGLNVRNRGKLPQSGPAIIVANHNSHLDTVVLMTLLDPKLLRITHPLAAADYFLSNKWLAWFSQKIVGIIPISRAGVKEIDPLLPCYEALRRNEIIILYPEGTRGEPEKLSCFKKGIAYLAEKFPTVPIIPVFMHGLGKALPKGEYLFVPFFCDVFVGDPIKCTSTREDFMEKLNMSFAQLALAGDFKPWQ